MRIAVENVGEVSALAVRPAGARCLLVLAHGAGAGMRHPFMETLAAELGAAGVATLRYQFPYMEQRRHIPDRPGVLTATVRAAVQAARKAYPDLPLLAGGKSLGARMTSTAAAEEPFVAAGSTRARYPGGVRGLVFFGFPLHAPGKPGTKRADHLAKVTVPMLFLEGTRDAFADLKLLRPVVKKLGRKATLHIVETADHSFHVLKSAGRSDAEVLRELAQTVAEWAKGIC